MKSVYVGNLPYATTDNELKALFEPYGTVISARLKTDRDTGRPLGYGFVQMEDEDAAKAIEALDGKEMAGRNLRVNESRERTAPGMDRPPRREFGDRPPRREFGDRPPRREFGDRPPRREFGDHPPRREFSDRPPRREFDGDRPPRREFDGDRPPRREFDGDRPPRREFGDRPPRRDFEGDHFHRDFPDRAPRHDFNSVGDARFGGSSFVPHHEDDYEMDNDDNMDYTLHTEEFDSSERRRRPFRKPVKDFRRDSRDNDRPRRPFMKSGPRKKGFRPNEDFDSED